MTTVYIDIVGDLFHRGHVEFIKKCKKFGYLIVGIHSDKDCTKYKRTPIYNMKDRIEIIKAIKYVDKVIPNAPLYITKEFININNIELIIHGNDENEEFKKMYKIPIEIGIFKTVPYTKGISTTDIINKIKNGNY